MCANDVQHVGRSSRATCVPKHILLSIQNVQFCFAQFPHCAVNCLQNAHSSGQGAIVCKSRRALITCNMCAEAYTAKHKKNVQFCFAQFPHCAVNCLQNVHSSGQGAIVCKSRAIRRALITCNMCATWYKGTAQPFSLTELTSQLS